MLYDRSYMRSETNDSGKRSALKTILLLLIASFVLQRLGDVWLHSNFLGNYLSLSSINASEGFIWVFLTYSFLHADLSHIILNLLGLFFIGRIVEALLGPERFLRLYLISALIGGITWWAFHYNDSSFLVGASAALSGTLAYFCLARWEQRMTLLLFFIIPVSVKPKWIFWLIAYTELGCFVLYELPAVNNYTIANSAHLGGLMSGCLFYYWPLTQLSFFRMRPKMNDNIQKSFKKDHPFTINLTRRDELKNEVDHILDKISAEGLASLSPQERQTLERARKYLNR